LILTTTALGATMAGITITLGEIMALGIIQVHGVVVIAVLGTIQAHGATAVRGITQTGETHLWATKMALGITTLGKMVLGVTTVTTSPFQPIQSPVPAVK